MRMVFDAFHVEKIGLSILIHLFRGGEKKKKEADKIVIDANDLFFPCPTIQFEQKASKLISLFSCGFLLLVAVQWDLFCRFIETKHSVMW